MSNRDSLGDRMKGYENSYRVYLPKRMPVIIRVDGKAFHSFTKGFKRPFDDLLISCMQTTAIRLCNQIEGAKLAYVQSDEISILLTNNDTIETEPWFSNNLQKLASIAASMATLAFNREWNNLVDEYDMDYEAFAMFDEPYEKEEKRELQNRLFHAYDKASRNGALFDARAFILPEDEVVNYFWWRQLDATRNSIQMAAQYYFSHNELQGLNCNELQNKLLTEKNVNWNNYPTSCKRGSCILKKDIKVLVNTNFNYDCEKEPNFQEVIRKKWIIDQDIPLFNMNREYIQNLLPREKNL